MNTLDNILFYTIRRFFDNSGSLSPIESGIDVPFNIQRIFYVYGVNPDAVRGKHAHYKTEQVLICLEGKCEVICDDGKNSATYTLDSPDKALYLPSLIWGEQIYKSDKTMLLVLTNTPYNKEDYIFDYNEFLSVKKKI